VELLVFGVEQMLMEADLVQSEEELIKVDLEQMLAILFL
jgi:hypothetical protein